MMCVRVPTYFEISPSHEPFSHALMGIVVAQTKVLLSCITATCAPMVGAV